VSPGEWRINNHQLTSGAEYAHNAAIMMRTEAQGCIEEAEKEQVRRLTDTNKDIDDRLKDIDTWVNNEKDELKFNVNQAHELLELKERLEVMMKNIETPLEISQENVLARESRQGAELVHDAVEESLLKEIETMRRNQDKLMDEMNRLNQQLTRLRAARHEIEMDIRNKEDARKTDECVRLLSKLSNEIGGTEVINGLLTNSSPTTWILNSQNLIQKSVEERNMSQVLYTEVIRTMLGCADETFNVWYETNSSFNTRVSEIITAKQQLEKQLVKITQDIESVNKHMIKVKNALDEKLPQLKLATARLDKRKQRPGIELCHDKVMLALYREIYALKHAVDMLSSKLHDLVLKITSLNKNKNK
ncbi:Tektin-3, partial [Folsomia candida]